MDRVRELKIMPVCSPAETIEELRFQIEILLESYDKLLLKKQLEDKYDGE